MRKTIVIATMMFAACGIGCDNDGALEGTYVNHSEGKFSIADDTLRISKRDGHFAVLRSTGFNLIRGDTVGTREYETEAWVLVYDQTVSAYRDARRGKVIHYDDRTKVLRIGNREYSKIK